MVDEQHDSFVSGGSRLTSIVTPPRSPAGVRSAVVVLAHGLANDRDEAGQFPVLAERLAEVGYVVVRFDFRGTVHHHAPGHMFPAAEWCHDLLAAVAYTRSRPDVDPSRVVVIGASCGGSVAVQTAAVAPDLRGVATLGSFGDGGRWFRELWTTVHDEKRWAWFLDELSVDRERRALGEPSRRVPLAGGFLPVLAQDLPEVRAFIDANPGMVDALPLEVADDLLMFAPEQFGSRLPMPILIAHGTADALVSAAESGFFAAALPQAEHRMFVGAPHQLLLGDQRAEILAMLVEWIARCCPA